MNEYSVVFLVEGEKFKIQHLPSGLHIIAAPTPDIAELVLFFKVFVAVRKHFPGKI